MGRKLPSKINIHTHTPNTMLHPLVAHPCQSLHLLSYPWPRLQAHNESAPASHAHETAWASVRTPCTNLGTCGPRITVALCRLTNASHIMCQARKPHTHTCTPASNNTNGLLSWPPPKLAGATWPTAMHTLQRLCSCARSRLRCKHRTARCNLNV